MNVKCSPAHGWLTDNQVDWIDEAFPTDVQELLLEVSMPNSARIRVLAFILKVKAVQMTFLRHNVVE